MTSISIANKMSYLWISIHWALLMFRVLKGKTTLFLSQIFHLVPVSDSIFGVRRELQFLNFQRTIVLLMSHQKWCRFHLVQLQGRYYMLYLDITSVFLFPQKLMHYSIWICAFCSVRSSLVVKLSRLLHLLYFGWVLRTCMVIDSWLSLWHLAR